jgi:alkylation response protein AidB-like acyl-CoA dehydrogenase
LFSIPEEPDHRRQLRASVGDFIARDAAPKAVRAALASADGFSRERWRKMAELGWTALLIPEEAGGLSLTHADMAALHQEVGRASLPEPLIVVPLLAARLLAAGENKALRENVLPRLLSGEAIATLAWQRGSGSLGAGDIGPTATSVEGGFRLSGSAAFVPLADCTDGTIVAARCPEGVLLAWLDDVPGVRVVTRHADGSRQATVTFDGLKVAADTMIAGPADGARLLEEALDTARLAMSAELLGLAEQAFTMTLDFLKQRNQFGRPLAAFQALQHRCVDLYIQIELARSSLLRAVALFETPSTDNQRAAGVSAAKSRCGDAALLVAKECIQFHGAIGYTDEYDLSLYVKRMLALSAWLGNPRAHRSRWYRLQQAAGASFNGH